MWLTESWPRHLPNSFNGLFSTCRARLHHNLELKQHQRTSVGMSAVVLPFIHPHLPLWALVTGPRPVSGFNSVRTGTFLIRGTGTRSRSLPSFNRRTEQRGWKETSCSICSVKRSGVKVYPARATAEKKICGSPVRRCCFIPSEMKESMLKPKELCLTPARGNSPR